MIWRATTKMLDFISSSRTGFRPAEKPSPGAPRDRGGEISRILKTECVAVTPASVPSAGKELSWDYPLSPSARLGLLSAAGEATDVGAEEAEAAGKRWSEGSSRAGKAKK